MNSRVLSNIFREIKNNKLSIISIIIVFLFIILSSLAFLSPYDPNKINISNRLLKPSLKHIFGTDEMGRDYFTRALYGGRISLSVGFISMLISTIIGTILGTVSGYFGNKVDSTIMRFIDILMCIPSFFLILILNAYLKPGITNIILIIGFLSWMGVARIVRSETLSIKEREFILCAQALGIKSSSIIFRHIIPNTSASVIVASTINIAGAILTESSLSFLGLGVQQPNASWGSMLQNAQGYIGDSTYLAVFPGLLILLTVLSFNVVGDVLRISLDPKINDR